MEVNGAQLYYEKVGQGPPLLMIHGNGESCEIFRVATDKLKNDFCVYLVDTRAHGKSSGHKNEYHYFEFADDFAQLIEKLNLQKPIVFGFSDGAIIGLLLARDHKNISRLIASGLNTHCEQLMETGVFDAIFAEREQSKDKNFRALMTLMLNEPKISLQSLSNVDIPILLTVGENDVVTFETSEQICKSLPNAKLLLIKNADHSSYVVNNEMIADIIISSMEK